MKLTDLKFGNVVKLSDGTLCLIHPVKNYSQKNIEEYLLNHKIYDVHFRNLKTGSLTTCLSEYDDDFNQKNDSYCDGFDIMEIYEDYTLKNLLWKREEKKTTNKR